MGTWSKFDDGEQLRDEIESRTRNGETCAQIAAALNAKGFDVSSKTISRRRVEWGLRKRASPRTKGTIRPNLRRPRPLSQHLAPGSQLCGKRNASSRKAEITARTQRGETAEEICAALTAEGVETKKGASSILRLQTYWGLIPYDSDRAFGRGKYKKKAPSQSARTEQNAASVEAQCCPSNCRSDPDIETRDIPGTSSFAIRGMGEPSVEGGIDGANTPWDNNSPGSDPTSPLDPGNSQSAETQDALEPFTQTVDTVTSTFPPLMNSVQHATEIVSAQLLIDLTSSAVSAATELKNLLNSMQVRTEDGVAQPTFATMQAIANAKRKIAHGSQVALNLVSEATNPPNLT